MTNNLHIFQDLYILYKLFTQAFYHFSVSIYAPKKKKCSNLINSDLYISYGKIKFIVYFGKATKESSTRYAN